MDNMQQTGQQQERRSYQRVQDAVGLRIQRLHELPAAGDANEKQTARRVRKPNKYDITGYAEVKREYPAVAEYVGELEERIRQLLLNGAQPADRPTHKVSLSASGMAFADDALMYPGELIGITITLFPSLKQVACDARVVSAGDAAEIAHGDKHTYRINFVRITDDDKAGLDQHVHALLKTIPVDVD